MPSNLGSIHGSVLVLSPHTADGVLGCGGSIARFEQEGCKIHYAVFSTSEGSLYPGFSPGALQREVKEATTVLGIPSEKLHLYDYPQRRFDEYRSDVLDELIRLREDIHPTLVLVPSSADVERDHAVVYEGALQAFKKECLLGYELPWNIFVFASRAFVVLQERHVQKKIDALERFISQRSQFYLNPESIRSMAFMRGTQIAEGFAEAFEAIRWIVA